MNEYQKNKDSHDLAISAMSPSYCRRCNKSGSELGAEPCHQSEKPQPPVAGEKHFIHYEESGSVDWEKLVPKPQPEQWFEELEMYKKSATEAIMTFDPKHTFCTICGTDPEKLITHLKGVLDSVLLAQKEQMLEGLREMRQNPETSHYATFANLLDGGESLRRVAGIYNSALEDVEEKIKGL